MFYTSIKYPDYTFSFQYIIYKINKQKYRLWDKRNHNETHMSFKSLEDAKKYVERKEKKDTATKYDSNYI